MARIFLYLDGTQPIGLNLIVAAPTGRVYEHQCARLATDCQRLEVYLIATSGPETARPLSDWF
ncbi:MAG: hypothetical protein ACRDD1_06305 [Planctomycetia bacterium]